tara:strand:- start:46 stop:315 length:270 start_codon:yes stop_codon:yes gene_type:complete
MERAKASLKQEQRAVMQKQEAKKSTIQKTLKVVEKEFQYMEDMRTRVGELLQVHTERMCEGTDNPFNNIFFLGRLVFIFMTIMTSFGYY